MRGKINVEKNTEYMLIGILDINFLERKKERVFMVIWKIMILFQIVLNRKFSRIKIRQYIIDLSLQMSGRVGVKMDGIFVM